MEQTRKLQDLEINQKYTALGRREINTSFGKTYILKVRDANDNEFQLFSTRSITIYIDKESPKSPFEFVVTEGDKGKYVTIENYDHSANKFIPF
jgi:hypothetical protein